MRSAYDVAVIGAGHNGLTAAALLAKRGRRVLLLERRGVIGGLSASEEFHPGFKSVGVRHDSSGVRPDVVDALELRGHGLTVTPDRPDVLALEPGSGSLLVRGDPSRTALEIEARSRDDAARYVDLDRLHRRFRPVLREFLHKPPLDLTNVDSLETWDALKRALRIRRLGRSTMMELLRLPPMCVADWLDEWFATDILKAALALPAVAGTFLGPRSPGSNFNLLLAEAAAGVSVAGGGPMLIAALERAARSRGVEIRTGSAVARIEAGAEGVEGLVLESGEEIPVRTVAASCDPKRVFLELLRPGSVSSTLEHHVSKIRAQGTTAHVLLAVDGPVEFAGATGGPVARARLCGSLDQLERAFDPVKYGALPERPALDLLLPTVADPSLAPAGKSVVSVLTHFVPYDPNGGWTDDRRDRLAGTVTAILEEHVPGLSGKIVGRSVLSPVDLEARYGVSGGNIHHVDHALDQRLLRPVPGCCRYGTPVRGLFLCGSGSHPGGGLTCGPGSLAASAILGSDPGPV